jgi:NB-ARC domain
VLVSESKHYPAYLLDAVVALVEKWHLPVPPPQALLQLRIVIAALDAAPLDQRAAVKQVVAEALDQLAEQDPRLGKLLRLYYLEDKSVKATAQALHIAESTYYNARNDAFDRLTQIIWQREQQARHTQLAHCLLRLEAPTYDKLLGIEAHLDELLAQFVALASPWIISIEGIGGLGKTALADLLVRRLITQGDFADFAWITTRRQQLRLNGTLTQVEQPLRSLQQAIDALVYQLGNGEPLYTTLPLAQKLAFLEQRLHQLPHLLVIDNLESFDDLAEWLPLLRRWINPTKILLTSRQQLDVEAGIYPFRLPELKQQHALDLVRQEAALRNLPIFATAADDQLLPIYATVGGNPLAIRLVVGQLYAHDFALVLEDLVKARGAKAEALYAYIYAQAWARLDDLARQVWLLMPLLIGAHATVESLTDLSGLAATDVRHALDLLSAQNLINCHGEFDQHSYTLHSLTQTFLKEQVALWH